MPNYAVHYFMIKPTHVPVQRGSTGASGTFSPVSGSVNAVRTRILADFETRLAQFMTQSAGHIPGSSGAWTASVQRIPESSPGVPNFAPVSIQPHEPIVYIVTRNNDLSHGSSVLPTNRRASLVLFAAVNGHYSAIPREQMMAARQEVLSDPQTIAGKAHSFSNYTPAVAEVFGDLRMQYDASNWEEIQAQTLANVAFHEIAHCKAECENRGAGAHWHGALAGSIHDVSGVSLCGSAVSNSTRPATADFRLMGEHMLCPIRFYKLGEPIGGQFFTHGQSVQLIPRGSGGGAGGSSSGTGGGAGGGTDPLSDLDNLDDI